MAIPVSDRCCCGCCHVKTGTWILVIVQLIGALYSVIRGAVLLSRHDHEAETREVISVVFSAVYLLSVLLVIVALIKSRPKLMLLHLFISVSQSQSQGSISANSYTSPSGSLHSMEYCKSCVVRRGSRASRNRSRFHRRQR